MQAPPGESAVPSLFADDSGMRPPVPAPGLLAELEGEKQARRTSPGSLGGRLKRRRWQVAGMAIAALLLASIHHLASPTRGAGAAHEGAGSPPAGASTGAEPARPAVILDDPPPSRFVPGGGRVGFTEGAGADPLHFLREPADPVPAPVVRRRAPPAKTDSDVDLLAALVLHAGRTVPGREAIATGQAGAAPVVHAPDGLPGNDADTSRAEAVSRALAACPAANTEAGLACRQAACSDRWGEHPSCPRPTAGPTPAG